MAFPRNHLYLTVHWIPSSAPLETGQFGLRFDTQAATTQALVDACKPAVQTFWAALGDLVPTDMGLKFLRLARIGTDGKYIPGSVAYDAVYGAGTIAGGGGATPIYPLQMSMVTTLKTAVPRGQGSHGRVYLPAPSSALGSDYRWPATSADARSAGLTTMVQSLNTVIGGPLVVASRGTVRGGPGLFQTVTGLQTGRRPDVQRRRARAVTELYGQLTTV